jgi:hypothetical protein
LNPYSTRTAMVRVALTSSVRRAGKASTSTMIPGSTSIR